MLSFITAALLATGPLGVPPPPQTHAEPSEDVRAPAPRTDPLLAAAFGAGEVAGAVAPPAPGTGAPLRTFGLALGLALAAGGAALWARRHRRRAPEVPLLQVLQVQRVGPRQSLVVAKLGSQTLVLGATDGGIQLLSTRETGAPTPRPTPLSTGAPPARSGGREAAALFEVALGQATEDQELREKLAVRRTAS